MDEGEANFTRERECSGLGRTSEPLLGHVVGKQVLQTKPIKISKIFLSSATERSAVFRIVTMVHALQW